MPDALQLIPASSPQWSEWVERAPHDFHHGAAHHLVWQESGGGEGWLAVYGNPGRYVAWPYLLRKIDTPAAGGQTLYDITAVDGYSGPLFAGCSPGDQFLEGALRRIFASWRESGVVSAFARFHPLLQNQLCFLDRATPPSECPQFPGLRHEGHTVSMDLHLGDAEARSEYRSSHWRHIQRAARLGLVAEPDDSPAAFREFVRIYHGTMRRNHAAPHYFFSEYFLDRLRQALAPGASIHLARLQGRPVAAVFVTEFSGIVQYVLGGADASVYHLSPLKLLLDSVRRWARERGNHTFHLGGGRGCRDEDPLFYFKSGFSRRRHCFYTGRWILDRGAYDWLAREHQRTASAPPAADYFPAYRAPLPETKIDPAVRAAPAGAARLLAYPNEEVSSRATSRCAGSI